MVIRYIYQYCFAYCNVKKILIVYNSVRRPPSNVLLTVQVISHKILLPYLRSVRTVFIRWLLPPLFWHIPCLCSDSRRKRDINATLVNINALNNMGSDVSFWPAHLQRRCLLVSLALARSLSISFDLHSDLVLLKR